MLAHVDLDSFLIAVERMRDPALRDRAVVIGGSRGARGVVAAASREARRRGVRSGQLLAQASITCPDAVFLAGSFDAYLQASRAVDEIFRGEGADVEWLSVDEAFLSFPSASGGRAVEAIERIQRALHDKHLDAACGVARSRVVARIASRLAHPCGVVYILDGYERRFLAPLKIEMLPDLDATLARTLRRAGIRRLGQLARLSETQLSLLAGRKALTLARRAAGVDGTRLERASLPPSPIADHELAEATAVPEVVQEAVRAEATRLGRDLRARRLFARSLTLRVRYADGHVESRTAPLREPSALDEVLAAAALDMLSRLGHGERLVRAVGVSSSGLLDGRKAPALFPGAAL